MNTPRTRVAVARMLLPWLAAASASSAADAAVTATRAGADAQTQAGIGAPDTVRSSSDRSDDVAADPYVVSRSDSRDEKYLVQVIDSARSAVQFDGPEQADFFVSSSVDASAGVGDPRFQAQAHGTASGSAFYDFSVDTASTLSFAVSAFPTPATPLADAYVALNLFSYDSFTYLRQGHVAGAETFAYTVPMGRYGITLTTFAEASLPADIRVNSEARSGAVANLSLSVAAVSPPVPEPATWWLLLFGIGVIGMAHRVIGKDGSPKSPAGRTGKA